MHIEICFVYWYIVLEAIVRSVPTTTSTVTTTPSKTTIVRSNYIYAYFPLNTQRFTFKGNYISFSIVTSIKNILFLVKTKNDVHVALSVDAKGSNVNELVIGGLKLVSKPTKNGSRWWIFYIRQTRIDTGIGLFS